MKASRCSFPCARWSRFAAKICRRGRRRFGARLGVEFAAHRQKSDFGASPRRIPRRARQRRKNARLGGRRHFVDAVAESGSGKRFLVSLKWQQVSGTAEQKVPYEVICLSEAVLGSGGEFAKAYLVLGGEGWSLREFFVKGGLQKHLAHAEFVTIISLEGFVAKANRGEL